MGNSMMINPYLNTPVVLPSMTYPMNITWSLPFPQNPATPKKREE